MSVELLLGDEAVGLGALHAGIAGVFSYPGTPATEILEFVRDRTLGTGRVTARWSANEKVAYEEALGMSYAGRRALVAMKHVGLNVAADPFMSSALTGAHAGLVLAVADDPGMHSSQSEQDSRYFGWFAKTPVFEPSNQQEAYDLTRQAFDLSERWRLPVMVRLVTRLAHSRSNVRALPAPLGDPPRVQERPSAKTWTLLPANARARFQRLLSMQPALAEFADTCEVNRLTLGGPRGIIACGIAVNYAREALRGDDSWTLLKIGTYPPPLRAIRSLVDHCDEIFVFEDGFPFVESQLRGLLGLPGKRLRGKLSGEVPQAGELTPDVVAEALGTARVRARPREAVPAREAAQVIGSCPVAGGCTCDPEAESRSAVASAVPGRAPVLCPGCPHADAFRALSAATESFATRMLFSDIGCYTLGYFPPHETVHTCVDMGASISMAHGAVQAGAFPVLCTIGDSTFTHSGMTALLDAIRADADMTVLILDNSVVAMTGGQSTMAHGNELIQILLGLGVRRERLHVIEPHPRRHAENVELLSREIAHRGLSVIVAARACIQIRPAARPTEARGETVTPGAPEPQAAAVGS